MYHVHIRWHYENGPEESFAQNLRVKQLSLSLTKAIPYPALWSSPELKLSLLATFGQINGHETRRII